MIQGSIIAIAVRHLEMYYNQHRIMCVLISMVEADIISDRTVNWMRGERLYHDWHLTTRAVRAIPAHTSEE